MAQARNSAEGPDESTSPEQHVPRRFRHPDPAVPTGETNNARARGSNAHRFPTCLAHTTKHKPAPYDHSPDKR